MLLFEGAPLSTPQWAIPHLKRGKLLFDWLLEGLCLFRFLIKHVFFTDEVKVQLAGSNLKNTLVKLLQETEHSTDEDVLATQKLAADLLVLLLTGGM